MIIVQGEFDIIFIMIHLMLKFARICDIIKSMAEPVFAEYIGKFKLKSVEFKNLSVGTIPPSIHGK